MKVLVLNGSPKGEKSVTLQSVRYLEKLFPTDSFVVKNVGKKIRTYEDADIISQLVAEIKEAELILTIYPVYTFLAPAQLHRFFEILVENGISVAGKFCTQFSTSKRFFDVTAHGVIKKILLDLGGKYLNGLSADMEDLTVADGRKELVSWWKYIKHQFNNDIFELPLKNEPQKSPYYCRQYLLADAKKKEKTVYLITDAKKGSSLDNMISDFCAVFPYETKIIDLNVTAPKCGCLGCLKCAAEGVCAIKDGFPELLNEINSSDGFVCCFEIKNHATSSLFKAFFDRQFVNGHRPVTAGKPTGYIVSGRLSEEDVLMQYIDAKSAVGGNYNCGIVCDEKGTENDIKMLADKLSYALEEGVPLEHNFYEVGGMKIFRDMIWTMQGIMKADYRFFKKKKLLDFPQKKRSQMLLMRLLGRLLASKALNKKMPNMLADGMLMPYQKVIDKARPEE